MGENSKSLVVERLTTPLLWKDWRELKNPCYGEIEEIEDEVEKKFKLFSNFNVLADSPEDHRFINNKRTFYHADTAAYYKTIHKEWAILEAGLPSSIYVRAYTTRIDLMRAVIIGPEGTPYCHGLFFFDISIPSKYPAQPPEIFYLSYGLEVNPNLHRKGKVSLDILSSGFRHKLCLLLSVSIYLREREARNMTKTSSWHRVSPCYVHFTTRLRILKILWQGIFESEHTQSS